MKKAIFSAVLMSAFITTSCSSLNTSQRQEMREWKAQSLVVEEKNETVAAALNVLPGFGDFYNGNIAIGAGNLLLWPLSILWAPVGGATGAAEVNYYTTKHTVNELEKNKQLVLSELQTAFMTNQISKEEYFLGTQKVKTMKLADFKNKVVVTDIIPTNAVMIREPSSLNKN